MRNACAQAIHQFFQERGVYVDAHPHHHRQRLRGAGEMFAVTGLDLTKVPLTKEGLVDYTQDFFGKPAYLTVSGQLEAEIMAMAFTNVYTSLAPPSGLRTPTPLATWQNFGWVEPEMAFCDLVANMDLAEGTSSSTCSPPWWSSAPTIWRFFLTSALTNRPSHADNIYQQHLRAHHLYRSGKATGKRPTVHSEFPVEWSIDLQSEHER